MLYLDNTCARACACACTYARSCACIYIYICLKFSTTLFSLQFGTRKNPFWVQKNPLEARMLGPVIFILFNIMFL